MSLTTQQKEQMRRDGYLILPNAVPRERIDAALHAVYHAMGKGIPADQLTTWQSQSFFPDIARSPVVADLMNQSDLWPACAELLGEENVSQPNGGQLALRFPREPGAEARPPGPHVDGMHSPHNGVPKGTLASFSALAGVFLTDVARPDAGNFSVWPGSHLLLSKYFEEHGAKSLLEENRLPPIEWPAPLQIEAKAGDAVICHHLLGHSVAANVAPLPRFAVFFRLKHRDHDAHRVEVLTDLWRDWPGLNS